MLSSDVPPLAHIAVSASNPTISIQLIDTDLNVRSSGFGTLDEDVEPGIYEIRSQAGSAVESQLIALRAGERYEVPLHLDIPGVAPVAGSVSASPRRQQALNAAQREVPSDPSGNSVGELMVLVASRPDTKGFEGDALGSLTLYDSKGERVTNLEGAGVKRDEELNEWSLASGKLPAGGYALRMTPQDSGDGVPRRRVTEQSIWIADGWQTLVFVPSREQVLVPHLASIHMVRAGEEWDSESREIKMLEGLFVALQSGQASISRRQQGVVLDEKLSTPMLGIVAAHSALLADAPEFDFVDEICAGLGRMLPEHPDIRSLAWISRERRFRAAHYASADERENARQQLKPPMPAAVSWPPMLLASYQGLLRCDALWPELGMVAEDSTAESVSARLLIGGLWTAWAPADVRTPMDTAAEAPHANVATSGPISLLAVNLTNSLLRFAGRKMASRDWRALIAKMPATDVTSHRLKSFLTSTLETADAGNLVSYLASLDPEYVSSSTGLPVRVVKTMLDTFAKAAQKGA